MPKRLWDELSPERPRSRRCPFRDGDGGFPSRTNGSSHRGFPGARGTGGTRGQDRGPLGSIDRALPRGRGGAPARDSTARVHAGTLAHGAPRAGSGSRGQGCGVLPVALEAPVSAPDMGEVQLKPVPDAEPPVSSKKVQFPARPSLGKSGREIRVQANHFHMKLLEHKVVCQYDVKIQPKVISRDTNRAIMRELVREYAGNSFGGRLPVYDGRDTLYTAGPLPFDDMKFQVELQDDPRRKVMKPTYQVKVVKVREVDLGHLLSFMSEKQAEGLRVLDIVLRELPTREYTAIGRSFYSPSLGQENLGAGLVGWRGFSQSVRPTQMGLSLNVDISATAFLQPIAVLDFVHQHLSDRRMAWPPPAAGNSNPRFNTRTGFTPEQKREVSKSLKGIKVEVTHRGNQRRTYRVKKLTDQPTWELEFPVSDYFRQTYRYTIQHPELPCLDAGSSQKPVYLPMELCKIVSGQRYPAKQLPEQIRGRLLRMTSKQQPSARMQEIESIMEKNRYGEDESAQEFGSMKIAGRATELKARILDPPVLLYDGPPGRDNSLQVSSGTWNMYQRKFVGGGIVPSWACVNFDPRVSDTAAERFCDSLARKCSNLGMQFEEFPICGIQNLCPSYADLKEFLVRCCPGGGTKLGLLIAILPDRKADWYGELKTICETEVGVVSQCCATKHVFKCSDQYLANVALKMNIKVGGRNTVLKDAVDCRLPTLGRSRTIIFGADVTHPGPGEDRSRVSSVAAIVGSQDWPEVTTYAGLVSAQDGGTEIIKELGSMVGQLLKSFCSRTNLDLPQRILFYRDGVSEGQFKDVLCSELTAIQRACTFIREDYMPRITFVVVQKRHHTRFFPSGPSSSSPSGNVPAGTVVDTAICHPHEFDFYLCSHAGILGTSRPAHYHVLWDENDFTADSLQTLTNSLCSTYARCTKSVSIVPPAYYAHHLATRGRLYMGAGGARDLPRLHNRIKPTMFYC